MPEEKTEDETTYFWSLQIRFKFEVPKNDTGDYLRKGETLLVEI